MEVVIQGFSVNFSHRPVLFFRDSRGDPILAVSSARNLIRRQHVRGIIGLGTLQQAAFVAELGNNSKVPVISLANDVPPCATFGWPFLVKAARSQFALMKAVAAIIQSW